MLDKMMEQFKDLAELQEFCGAQHKTIVSQSKKIQELEAEVTHLKGLLSSTVPILSVEKSLDAQLPPMTGLIEGAVSLNDEETISRQQLARLKHISMERELTLEEARRLEIFSKVINQIENRPKKNVIPTAVLSTEDLMKSLNSGNE